MPNHEITQDFRIRNERVEDINGSRFVVLKVEYIDDNSDGELWIPEDKAPDVGLVPEMIEDRENGAFPEVRATFTPQKRKRTKLSVSKLEIIE